MGRWIDGCKSMMLMTLLSIAMFGLVTASAQATSLRARVSVHAAHHVRTFTVTASTHRGATCGLLVRASKRSQSLPFLTTNAHGRAGWRWMAGRDVQRGTWRFAVRCVHDGKATTRRLVRHVRGGRHRGTVGEPDSFRAIRGRVIDARTKGTDPKGLGGEVNPFDWRQCTWWAWIQRADVYAAAVSKGVPAGGSRGRSQGETVYVWDGMMWFQNAQKAEIPTGSTPVVGALASWGDSPGNPYGHVAYVEEVQAPDRIRVSECNGFTLVCGDYWVNPNTRKGRLLGYVYGGPAGNPGTPVLTPAPAAPKLTISGSCTTSGGVLTGSSSGFSPGGTATIHAWYPDGNEYTNLIHVSRVRPDGTIAWTWPCEGDRDGTYTTEATDDATGSTTGRVSFTIGNPTPPDTTPPDTTSPPSPSTYNEQQGGHGVDTFTNYHNASGKGQRIDPGAWVQVSCKVKDTTIASVNPDGYWYRITSAPWNDAFYAPANTFMNGDPWGGPYSHNTDFGVRDC
jgi:surface antigen